MQSISKNVLAQRLSNRQHCEYLYTVYDKQINSIICNEYGLNCPPLVSQLISEFAHSNTELQTIFKNKLFYQHYIHLYGENSFYHKQLLILRNISTALLIFDYTMTSVKYLFNINTVDITAMSFAVSVAMYSFNYNIRRFINYGTCKIAHRQARLLTKHHKTIRNSTTVSQKQKLENIVSDFELYFESRQPMYRENAMDSMMTNGFNLGTHLFSEYETRFGTVLKFICSHCLDITAAFPTTEDIRLPTEYPNKRVTPPSITAILLEPNDGNRMQLLFQLWVTMLSLHRWNKNRHQKLHISWSKRPITENIFVRKLYAIQRMANIYPIVSQIMDNFVGSYKVHFNGLPLVNVSKAINVSLYWISSFTSFVFGTFWKRKGKPRDLFEWTYCVLRQYMSPIRVVPV